MYLDYPSSAWAPIRPRSSCCCSSLEGVCRLVDRFEAFGHIPFLPRPPCCWLRLPFSCRFALVTAVECSVSALDLSLHHILLASMAKSAATPIMAAEEFKVITLICDTDCESGRGEPGCGKWGGGESGGGHGGLCGGLSGGGGLHGGGGSGGGLGGGADGEGSAQSFISISEKLVCEYSPRCRWHGSFFEHGGESRNAAHSPAPPQLLATRAMPSLSARPISLSSSCEHELERCNCTFRSRFLIPVLGRSWRSESTISLSVAWPSGIGTESDTRSISTVNGNNVLIKKRSPGP